MMRLGELMVRLGKLIVRLGELMMGLMMRGGGFDMGGNLALQLQQD